MEWLQTTFVTADPEGSERRVVADQPVIIYRPKSKAAGLTFVVTAANMPLSKYTSTISALNSVDHVVVGFFVNVAYPLLNNHRAKAEKIAQIFQELQEEFRVKQYDIVGHSIGGKIALLTATMYDEDNLIGSIVALDPVDQHPVEFTHETTQSKKKGDTPPPQNPFKEGTDTATEDASITTNDSRWGRRTNLSLGYSKADITLTFTDTGYWIDKKHNAREIQKYNPSAKLVMHRNSCHMVYCDDSGLLSWKVFMGRGSSDDRNKRVREETLTLIKERAMRSSSTSASGKASGKMNSSMAKAKKAVASAKSDMKEIKGEAKKKGKGLGRAAAFAKVMK